MKKFSVIFLGLAILLCVTVTSCSGRTVPDESVSAIIDELIPENITNVELSGFNGGGVVVKSRTLTQTEIEELSEWVSQLSIKHRTFEEGKTPGDLNGATAYIFSFNDGETSFTWLGSGKEYIQYEGEWYEIMNTSKLPFGLPT